MTDALKVRAKHPGARAERHRQNSGRTYWLVRLRADDHLPFSHGDTERSAWRSALAKIEGGRASEDPRRVRAATLRQHVLSELISFGAVGRSVSELRASIRDRFPASYLSPTEVRRALAVLRRNGQVRYVRHSRPRWEVVDGR
jgi:hypothetical protein